MLVPENLQQPFAGGLTESHCSRCGKEGELPFGSICRSCTTELERRAARIARWASLTTTLAVGLYAYIALPEDRTSRTVGAVAVLMWYVFTYTAVRRAARLLLR